MYKKLELNQVVKCQKDWQIYQQRHKNVLKIYRFKNMGNLLSPLLQWTIIL
jgi:hypothetical protein